MGSKMRALDWDVGYGWSWRWRHHNEVNDVVLVSLLFLLDMFHAIVSCFRFWLWACRSLWGIICCKHVFLQFLEKFWFWYILSYRLISFINKILRKKKCKTSVDSFNAKKRHFQNFLRFYIYSSLDFEFIFKCYIRSHKFYFSKNVKTDTLGKFSFLLLYHQCLLI